VTDHAVSLDDPSYLAVAHWHRDRWHVRITAPDGTEAGALTAGSLDGIEDRVCGVLPEATGFAVEVDVPSSVYCLVAAADEIRSGILAPGRIVSAQLREAEIALTDLGVPDDDIVRIIGDRTESPAFGCHNPWV
jgi:hypothetical protein